MLTVYITNSKNIHLTKRHKPPGGYGGFRGFCGYGDSVRIPTCFSVSMECVWGLKSNPHGSPGVYVCMQHDANEAARRAGPSDTQGEVTSQSLWSRYDRHFVGITRHNALS